MSNTIDANSLPSDWGTKINVPNGTFWNSSGVDNVFYDAAIENYWDSDAYLEDDPYNDPSHVDMTYSDKLLDLEYIQYMDKWLNNSQSTYYKVILEGNKTLYINSFGLYSTHTNGLKSSKKTIVKKIVDDKGVNVLDFEGLNIEFYFFIDNNGFAFLPKSIESTGFRGVSDLNGTFKQSRLNRTLSRSYSKGIFKVERFHDIKSIKHSIFVSKRTQPNVDGLSYTHLGFYPLFINTFYDISNKNLQFLYNEPLNKFYNNSIIVKLYGAGSVSYHGESDYWEEGCQCSMRAPYYGSSPTLRLGKDGQKGSILFSDGTDTMTKDRTLFELNKELNKGLEQTDKRLIVIKVEPVGVFGLLDYRIHTVEADKKSYDNFMELYNVKMYKERIKDLEKKFSDSSSSLSALTAKVTNIERIMNSNKVDGDTTNYTIDTFQMYIDSFKNASAESTTKLNKVLRTLYDQKLVSADYSRLRDLGGLNLELTSAGRDYKEYKKIELYLRAFRVNTDPLSYIQSTRTKVAKYDSIVAKLDAFIHTSGPLDEEGKVEELKNILDAMRTSWNIDDLAAIRHEMTRLKGLEDIIAEKDRRINTLESDLAQKIQELNTANDTIRQKADEIRSKNEEIADKEHALGEAYSNLSSKEDVIQSMTRDNMRLEQEVRDLRNQLAQLRQQLSQKDQEIAAYRLKEAELNEKKLLLAQKEQEIIALNERINQQRTEIQTLTQQKTELERQFTEKNQSIESLRQELATEKDRVTQLTSQIERLTQDLDTANQAGIQKDARIQELTKELKASNSNVNEAYTQLEKANRDLEYARAKSQEERSRANSLRDQLKSKEQELESLTQSSTATSAELESKKAEIVRLLQSIAEKESSVNTLNLQIVELNKNIDTITITLEQVTTNFNTQGQELIKVLEELAKTKGIILEQDKTIGNLQDELNKAKTAPPKKELVVNEKIVEKVVIVQVKDNKQLDLANKEIQRLTQELTELKKRIDEDKRVLSMQSDYEFSKYDVLKYFTAWEKPFTREEFVKSMYTIIQLKSNGNMESTSSSKYSDYNDVYTDYMKSRNLIIGVSNDKFAKDVELTKDMFATFALRYNNKFDVAFKDSYEYAVKNGIIKDSNYNNKLQIIETVLSWK